MIRRIYIMERKPCSQIIRWMPIVSLLILLNACERGSGLPDTCHHELEFPNLGETLVKGNTYTIRWEDPLSSTLRLRLFQNGTLAQPIADEVPNDGSYEWEIPDSLSPGTLFRIHVLSNQDDFVYFRSALPFAILEKSQTSDFTDPRDGRVYRTVKLAGRWWMAENLKYDTVGSYVFHDDISNAESFGRLYTLNTAKAAAPPGWHLPSDGEWKSLESYLGLRYEELHVEGLRGVNAGELLLQDPHLGFNAELAGYVSTRWGSRFYSLNSIAQYWTATSDENPSRQFVRKLALSASGIERITMVPAYYALSVRYIKDE